MDLYDLADAPLPVAEWPLSELADLPTRLVERLALCGMTTVGKIQRKIGYAHKAIGAGPDSREQIERLVVGWLDAAGVKPVDGFQVVRCVAKLEGAK